MNHCIMWKISLSNSSPGFIDLCEDSDHSLNCEQSTYKTLTLKIGHFILLNVFLIFLQKSEERVNKDGRSRIYV